MARPYSIVLVSLLVLAAGCDKTSGSGKPAGAASAEPASSLPAGKANPTTRLVGDPERGRALAEKFECNRCHEGTGLAPASFEKHCFQCHQDINNDQFEKHFKAPKDKLAKWKKTVAVYLNAPQFDAAGARYRSEYIQAFLLSPQKVRPHMVSSMPRLAITPQQAADVAAYLTRAGGMPDGGPVEGDATAGRAVLESKACGTCHLFSGVPELMLKPNMAAADAKGKDAIELAPDLRFTRDRMTVQGLVAWLRDPTKVRPGTLMPDMKLSEKEARDAAVYIATTPLSPIAHKPIPKRLPLLERKVTFDEVDQKVLGVTCRHCHTNPDIARGDGGPGMTGGFGFVPRKLNLSSYEGVSAGLLDDKGERMSVFIPTKDGTPRLVASLIARQKEEAGQVDPEVRGMPLGLPALTPEQIQLVESWVAQGRPQ